MGQTGSERAGGKGLGRAPSGPQQEETQALLLPQQQKSDKVVSRKNSSTLGTASTGDASQASSREAAAALLRKQRTTSQFNSQFSSQKRGLLSRARALPSRVWSSGVACMLLASGMFSVNTVFVKLLGARVPVLELSAIRGFLSVVMSLMMGAYMGLKGLKVLGAKERWGLLTVRGVFGACSLVCGYTSVYKLNIANAVVIGNLNPPVTALAAYLVLKEPLGWKGWLGCFSSFAGVLVIAHPPWLFGGHEDWGPQRLMGTAAGISAAVLAAGSYLVIRKINTKEPTLVVSLWFHLATTLMCAGPVAASWPQKTVWWPETLDIFLLSAVSVIGFYALILFTRSFQLLSAGKASALNFAGVVYAYIWDITLFGHSICLTGVLGTCMVLAGVMLVALRPKGEAGASPSKLPPQATLVASSKSVHGGMSSGYLSKTHSLMQPCPKCSACNTPLTMSRKGSTLVFAAGDEAEDAPLLRSQGARLARKGTATGKGPGKLIGAKSGGAGDDEGGLFTPLEGLPLLSAAATAVTAKELGRTRSRSPVPSRKGSALPGMISRKVSQGGAGPDGLVPGSEVPSSALLVPGTPSNSDSVGIALDKMSYASLDDGRPNGDGSLESMAPEASFSSSVSPFAGAPSFAERGGARRIAPESCSFRDWQPRGEVISDAARPVLQRLLHSASFRACSCRACQLQRLLAQGGTAPGGPAVPGGPVLAGFGEDVPCIAGGAAAVSASAAAAAPSGPPAWGRTTSFTLFSGAPDALRGQGAGGSFRSVSFGRAWALGGAAATASMAAPGHAHHQHLHRSNSSGDAVLEGDEEEGGCAAAQAPREEEMEGTGIERSCSYCGGDGLVQLATSVANVRMETAMRRIPSCPFVAFATEPAFVAVPDTHF